MISSKEQSKIYNRLCFYLSKHPEVYEDAINEYIKRHNFTNAEDIGNPAPFTINIEIDNNPTYIHLTADVIMNEYIKQTEHTELNIGNRIKIKKVLIDANDTPLCKKYLWR